MKIEVKIRVAAVEDVKRVLDALDTDYIKKSHPNAEVTIEVACDAN